MVDFELMPLAMNRDVTDVRLRNKPDGTSTLSFRFSGKTYLYDVYRLTFAPSKNTFTVMHEDVVDGGVVKVTSTKWVSRGPKAALHQAIRRARARQAGVSEYNAIGVRRAHSTNRLERALNQVCGK